MSNTPQPTVLCEAIKEIDDDIKKLKKQLTTATQQVTQSIINGSIWVLQDAKRTLIKRLPREREQIEKSFEDGFHQDFYTEDETTSDYFTKNYVQK